jgi:hypothetical protein
MIYNTDVLAGSMVGVTAGIATLEAHTQRKVARESVFALAVVILMGLGLVIAEHPIILDLVLKLL